jgi:hypothetical protein
MRLEQILVAALLLAPTPISAAVTSSDTLPAGNTVDLRGFATNTPIESDDPAFRAAGIASITATADPSDGDEFYNAQARFSAGRALFSNEAGELIALDEKASVDFGSPKFTIKFMQRISKFGLRFVDTSHNYATPKIDFFRDGDQFDSVSITDDFNANTAFGFSAMPGFDRVDIDVDIDQSDLDAFDGVGITDLTTVVPVPAALPLMASGVAALALARRRARRGTGAGRPAD